MIPKEFSKIYLDKKNLAITKIKKLISKYSPDVIAIGNGTASNETFDLIKDEVNIPIYIVNESGVSVYSASEIGREEFPNLDATDRGTVSIARRFVDPLSELVKINPESIGVGMYQHDKNQKELSEKLGFVIESIVNQVGINLNTSSEYILRYISRFTKKSAKKVFEKRPYKSREELKKIISAKAFQQASGFLRIPDSKKKLDNTNIHPEQYKLAEFVIENKITPLNYKKEEIKLKKLYSDFTEQTLIDILDSYKNIGLDPRKYEAILKINKTITIDDLKEGNILTGVVRNIMQFGAFVDIGIKNDGLVHISQLADKFVKDPHEIVEIGEEVRVKIIGIDMKTNKIQLSMKDLD